MKRASRFILNIGCGEERYGDVRMDFVRTGAVTIVGDCQQLPFRDEMFTEVYERNVLEHIPNPAQHLLEVKRVLQLGGALHLITDNAACIKYYLLGTHMGSYSRHAGRDVHYALYTTEHIKNLMNYCGLKIEHLSLVDTDYFTRYFDHVVRLFLPAISYPRIMARGVKI